MFAKGNTFVGRRVPAVGLAFIALAITISSQADGAQVDVRMAARKVVMADMNKKYGPSGDVKMHKIYSAETSGAEKKVTGDGTYVLAKEKREFTFECLVDSKTGVVKDLKIHAQDVGVDIREIAVQEVERKMREKYGKESEPRLDKVYSAEFPGPEERVYGNGFYRLGGKQKTFKFECLVHKFSGHVRNLKIDERGGALEGPIRKTGNGGASPKGR
jgi:hypothetical protein